MVGPTAEQLESIKAFIKLDHFYYKVPEDSSDCSTLLIQQNSNVVLPNSCLLDNNQYLISSLSGGNRYLIDNGMNFTDLGHSFSTELFTDKQLCKIGINSELADTKEHQLLDVSPLIDSVSSSCSSASQQCICPLSQFSDLDYDSVFSLMSPCYENEFDPIDIVV